MITAVRAWRRHKRAGSSSEVDQRCAFEKASGRVFQTDTDFDKMGTAAGALTDDWKRLDPAQAAISSILITRSQPS